MLFQIGGDKKALFGDDLEIVLQSAFHGVCQGVDMVGWNGKNLSGNDFRKRSVVRDNDGAVHRAGFGGGETKAFGQRRDDDCVRAVNVIRKFFRRNRFMENDGILQMQHLDQFLRFLQAFSDGLRAADESQQADVRMRLVDFRKGPQQHRKAF